MNRYRVLSRVPRPLKTLLRPLLPLWTAFDRGANENAEQPKASFPAASTERPIWPMTRPEYEALAARDDYYSIRRRYLGAAAWVAADLIERYGLTTALELGPYIRPLVSGADVMDRVARPGLEASGAVLVHDATSTPWPVSGDRYDLFVALQVFEHLGTAQRTVFEEVRRVARHAIISVPVDWVMSDPGNVHHGITHERVLSWFEPTKPTRVIVGNPGYRQRLIYTFENLG